MIKRFINRTADIPGGEGGGLGPSLSDIEAGDDDTPGAGDDDKGDDGDADDLAGKDDKKNDDPQETPEEKKTREELEQKLEEQKADKDKKKDDEPAGDDKGDDAGDDGDDEPDDAEEFINDINALRGDEIEVDYGTVDPLSPEGVVIRERAVEDAAVAGFEEWMQEKHPKAYGFLMHSIAGKPTEEFFGKSNDLETLPTVEELEASVEIQKDQVVQNLLSKGLSEKAANSFVKQLIEDNELEEEAKKALGERDANQKKVLEGMQKEHDAKIAEKDKAIKNITGYIDQVVATGKIGNITIPEKDRTNFAKQIKENIRYENGKFLIVSELSDANAQDMFGKEYFSFKKGNLEGLVEKAAKTANAKRLKRTMPADKTPKAGADVRSKHVALGDLEAD